MLRVLQFGVPLLRILGTWGLICFKVIEKEKNMGIKQMVAEGMLASGNVQEALESCSRKLSELAEDGIKYPDTNRIMADIKAI